MQSGNKWTVVRTKRCFHSDWSIVGSLINIRSHLLPNSAQKAQLRFPPVGFLAPALARSKLSYSLMTSWLQKGEEVQAAGQAGGESDPGPLLPSGALGTSLHLNIGRPLWKTTTPQARQRIGKFIWPDVSPRGRGGQDVWFRVSHSASGLGENTPRHRIGTEQDAENFGRCV